MESVGFTRMADGTKEDYELLAGLEQKHIRKTPDRIMAALRALDGSLEGYKITRLEHSLQSATRAEADGADKEMVCAALIHDLGDELAPENHSQLAAAIIRPYVREEVTWVIEMHGLFQMPYYVHYFGQPVDRHLKYRDNPYFDSCMRFCDAWDQESFDPDYPTKPLEYFEPLVREIFSRKPFDPDILAGRGI
jgi:predicted HD phosphohydrolase